MSSPMFFRPTLIAAALALFAGSVSAATLYSDDFNRSDSSSVGNGWSELEADNGDVSVRRNKLRLRDYMPGSPDAAAASMVIDATGYENIEVAFRWKSLDGNEAVDKLLLSWGAAPAPAINNPGAWTQVFEGSDKDTTWFTESVSLAGAKNGLFNLLFWSDVSNTKEGFLIDYVEVTGDAYVAGAVAPVPLPAGLPLLMGGLAALGLLRRKRARS